MSLDCAGRIQNRRTRVSLKVYVCTHSVVPVFEFSYNARQSSEVRSPSVKVLNTHECVMFIDSSRSE